MNSHKSFFMVCGIGAVAGMVGILPLPLSLKAILLVVVLCALFFIKTDDGDK